MSPVDNGPPTLRPRRFGLRRQMLLMLPVATLALVAVSAISFLSFRGALAGVLEERRGEAARLARDLAVDLAPRGDAGLDATHVPAQARGVALLDAAGHPLARFGEMPPENLLAPLAGGAVGAAVGVGPGAEGEVVSGFAAYGAGAARRVVRVDLAVPILIAQRRAATFLGWILLGLNVGLALVVILFLRTALEPYETMLERARAAGAGVEGEDEAAFLVGTFERALAALARPPERPAGESAESDELAALERALGPNLESGLLLLDRAGALLAVNSVGAELLGVGGAAPGTPLAALLAGQPALAALLADAIAAGRGERRRECAIAAPGGERVVGLTLHPLRRDDGGVRGFLVLFADLTEVRRHEDESRLSQSLERLGELAAGVAHELRNSLATLKGYLTLIERRPDEETIADYLGEIRRETDHLQRVLEDFLAFARPGSARLEDLDLLAVVRRAAADPALAGAAIAVAAQPGEAARIRGDAQLLERALRNLLHNAVQAQRSAGAAGPVEVRLVREGDGVEVVIEDRGAGVPAELRDRLFHPFASGRADGVGLGLALTHRIVDLHGGRVTLEDRPGGGTRARVALPAAP
ncbi:MAG: sensor histidine kinase [Acidobacteriota bacterium]